MVQDAGYKGIAGSTKNRNYLTTLLTDSPPRHNREIATIRYFRIVPSRRAPARLFCARSFVKRSFINSFSPKKLAYVRIFAYLCSRFNLFLLAHEKEQDKKESKHKRKKDMEGKEQKNGLKNESKELKQKVEQVEQLLKEHKLLEALEILEPWAKETYKNQDTKDALEQFRQECKEASDLLQTGDNPEAKEALNKVTHSLYLLLDTLHVCSRLAEGSATVHKSFDRNNIDEIYQYFNDFLSPNDEVLDWLKDAARKEKEAHKTHMALLGMSHALKECFWEKSLFALMECIDSPVESISRHSAELVMEAMIYNDSRVRCYSELQEAFKKVIEKHGDGMWEDFIWHCQAVHDRYFGIGEPENEKLDPDNLPEEFFQIMEETGLTKEELLEEIPRDEEGYAQMHSVLNHLHGSWVAEAFIPYDEAKEDSDEKALPDSREGMLFYMTLSIGRGELLWADINQAEKWLKHQLEDEHSKNPLDYLHAGHLALHKGNKQKAMEFYRQAFDLSTNKPFLHDMFRCEKSQMVRVYNFDESLLNEVERQIDNL